MEVEQPSRRQIQYYLHHPRPQEQKQIDKEYYDGLCAHSKNHLLKFPFRFVSERFVANSHVLANRAARQKGIRIEALGFCLNGNGFILFVIR